jgi:hypothetical protein
MQYIYADHSLRNVRIRLSLRDNPTILFQDIGTSTGHVKQSKIVRCMAATISKSLYYINSQVRTQRHERPIIILRYKYHKP